MNFFTSRNLAILGLVQVGALVASVLAAGAAHKWYTTLPNLTGVPWCCRLMAEYGWLGLLLPVAWLSLTVAVFLRRSESDHARLGAVASGILIVFLFLLAGWFGAVRPWLQLLFSFD